MPARMNGITRPASMKRQMRGKVCNCATTEHTTTSEDVTVGGSTYSHGPIEVMAVPKPISPETKPPASAPAATMITCSAVMNDDVLWPGAAAAVSSDLTP